MKLYCGPTEQGSLKDRLRTLLKSISWPTRVAGILVSVLSMHLLVVRPLVERVGRLETELHEIDATLQKVARSRSTIRETNSLLENLKSQHDELARARATVRQLQILRKEIAAEAEQIPAAIESLKRLGELPEQVFQSEVDRYSAVPVPDPEQNTPDDFSESPMPIRIQEVLAEAEVTGNKGLFPRIVTTPRELYPISGHSK